MQPRRLAAAVPYLILIVLFLLSVGPVFAQEATEEATPEITDVPEGTPEATPETTEAAPEETPEATDAPQPTPECQSYTVAAGDTLARIAQRFGTSSERIASDNGITNVNLIFPGQQLQICAGTAPPPPAPTVTPVPGPTTTYVVQRGDTLASIAARFNTTIAQLQALNNLANANVIFVGQQLLISGPGPQPTVSPDATAVPVTFEADFDYGIEVYATPETAESVADMAVELGMHWVKVDVNWRDIEPVEGQRDYSSLDAIVNALIARDLDILFTVSTSPQWARTSVDEVGPPDDFADFTTFIGDLAAHFAGRVDAYEVWSEPNLRREWNSNIHAISPASYLSLLQPAYQAIKAADPEAIVVSAGLAPTGFNDGVNAINDRVYLDGLYRNGLAAISDAIGAHPGGWANPPDSVCCDPAVGVETHYEDPSFYFLGTLTDYRDIMVQNNDTETAIWVTKFGWGTSEDTEAPPPIYVFVTYTSLAEQAIYTPRAFEIARELGYIGPMFLHNLNGCQAVPASAELCYYSLIGPTGAQRPVYSAVAAIDTDAVLDDGAEAPAQPPTEAPAAPPAPAATEEAAAGPTATNVG